MLMHTRKLALESAGHQVVTAMSAPEIIAACHNRKIDVAVIGQSTDSKTKREWAALVRQHCPGAKILEVYTSNFGPSVPSADASLEAPAIPVKLAARVRELIKEERRD